MLLSDALPGIYQILYCSDQNLLEEMTEPPAEDKENIKLKIKVSTFLVKFYGSLLSLQGQLSRHGKLVGILFCLLTIYKEKEMLVLKGDISVGVMQSPLPSFFLRCPGTSIVAAFFIVIVTEWFLFLKYRQEQKRNTFIIILYSANLVKRGV